MLKLKYKLDEIAFIDIETAGEVKEFVALSEAKQAAVRYITDKLSPSDNNGRTTPAMWYNDKAALMPEIGMVVAISMGFFHNGIFKVKAYTGEEKMLLEDFMKDLNGLSGAGKANYICGHNIKSFDAPFIIKRCVINKVKIPTLLQIAEAKPWEVSLLDTMTLWKNGGWSNTNLPMLCACLGVPTPKDDISGKDVHFVYWQNEKDAVRRIALYCNKDVISTARVYQAMTGKDIVADEHIAEFYGNEKL